jgi:hypothetical protein
MRITSSAFVFVVVLLLSGIVSAGASAQSPAGHGTDANSIIQIAGDWLVKGVVTESHTTIDAGGEITVASGGVLNLESVKLVMNESRNLQIGIVVRSGGVLTATNLTVLSSNPSLHTYIRESGGGMLTINGGTLEDLGGNVPGEYGVSVSTANTRITDVTFDNYYEAVHISGAPHVTLAGINVLNATGDNSTFAIITSGGSDDLHLVNSHFDIPQDVGAIDLNDPGAIVTGNTFNLDAAGTQIKPIDIGCSNGGLENASNSLFANNTVNGAGVFVEASSNTNVTGNIIENTGVNRPYGVLVQVPSGSAPGLWATGDVVTHNYISNFSRYGIRFQLNLSHFLISENTIVHPSTHPGPAWTEDFGGSQIDGIYVIRGISDGTISYNHIDMSDLPYIASNAILLESKVVDVKVIDNTVFNMTQNGVMVQGNVPYFVNNAPAWELGPSYGDLVANNLFDSMRYVDDDNFTYKGVLIWLWSNHTTVENNTFIGFQNVDSSSSSVNGAAVVCTGSYNILTNNTVIGARYAFAFTKYASLPHQYVGESNRSDNLVYDNHLSDITVAPVYETPGDGMGPLVNVIDALSNASTRGGAPTSYLESMSPVSSMSLQEKAGTFTQTLRTQNPITGHVGTFVATAPSTWAAFNLTVAGSFEEQYPTLTVDQVNSSAVEYQVSPSTVAESHLVALDPTTVSYAANYSIATTVGKNRTTFSVKAPDGPASFTTSGIGTATVQVNLLNWQAKSPPPANNTTVGGQRWAIWGNITLANKASPANLAVDLEFSLANGTGHVITLRTSEQGEFGATNLTFNGTYESVELGPANYTVVNATVTQPTPAVLTIWVFAAPATVPNPNGTPPPPPPPPFHIGHPSGATRPGQGSYPGLPASPSSLVIGMGTILALGVAVILAGAIIAAGATSGKRALEPGAPARLHRTRRHGPT